MTEWNSINTVPPILTVIWILRLCWSLIWSAEVEFLSSLHNLVSNSPTLITALHVNSPAHCFCAVSIALNICTHVQYVWKCKGLKRGSGILNSPSWWMNHEPKRASLSDFNTAWPGHYHVSKHNVVLLEQLDFYRCFSPSFRRSFCPETD